MQPMPMIGLIPYIYLMYQYNSYRAYIIFINGLIYHYNDKSVKLRYYDILCNFTIGYYSFCTTKQLTYEAGYIGFLSFILNNFLFYKFQINETYSYSAHVLFTQWPICYFLFNELNCQLV
jgi:hypothetical protein